MQIEQIYCHKGIGFEASEELLAPGFLPFKEDISGTSKISNNFYCRKDGELEARTPFYLAQGAAMASAAVYGIWALSTSCFALCNAQIFYKAFASGSFASKHTMTYGQYLTHGYYKNWLFLKNYYPTGGVYSSTTTTVTNTSFIANQSYDMGYWSSAGFDTFSTAFCEGHYMGDVAGVSFHTLCRFQNVTIPQGATITAAKIVFYASGEENGADCDLNVYFNNVDDASLPANAAAADLLAVTSAVAWNNVEAFGTVESGHDSPELKTILQTVINRSGWASGHDLLALAKNNSSSTGHYRGTLSNLPYGRGAALVVSYTYTTTISWNTQNNVMCDASGNVYFPTVAAPATSPSGAAGSGGNPNGVYKLYCSYLITYPNGSKYETGLCAASSDVTVSSQQIAWTSIPTATAASITATGSTAATIHRKLYRGPGTGGTLADIYYVATIADNTTTTYTDNSTDATLISNGVCDVEDFLPMGYGHIFAFHYGRYYEADYQYPWRLNYSEAAYGDTGAQNEVILPIATKSTNWNDVRAVAMGSLEFISALVSWGTTLYIGYPKGWIKKSGEDPDTWSMKKTSAIIGPEHPEWLCIMEKPFGIVFLARNDNNDIGLYVFDGDNSVRVGSPQIDGILRSLSFSNQTRLRRSGSSLLITGAGTGYGLTLDFSRYPEIRVANFQGYADATYGALSCVETIRPPAALSNSGKIYGTASGYILADSGIFTTSSTELATGGTVYFPRRSGGKQELANMTKVLKKLKYNIYPGKYYSGGSYYYSEARIAVYLDGDTSYVTWGQAGTAYWSVTTEGKGEIPFPPNTRCKTYRIVVTFISDSGQTIGFTYTPKAYMPWDVLFDIVED